MATDEHYLHASSQIFDNIMLEPHWDFPNFPVATQTSSLPTADGPFLQIVEQPKQRGFRFRYGCEGPSHGGLPGASSEKNKKTFPTVKICNYQGPARLVVQLVTGASSTLPQLHAHSLVGKQCDKGICIVELQPKDCTVSFPNLGILHVTKKNVSRTLEDRMVEAIRMGHNHGVSIHPDIDHQQGELRVPQELTDQQRSLVALSASQQAKDMDLSVVRLMFTAFLPDSDGGFSRRLHPVVSEPIYDSKAPNASNLKIVRMDRTAGCVSGGEEVYLLCDKVQKDDIQVRFYEENSSGPIWEALGDFSPTDVHRQFAIVFKTPKYRDQNLQKPTSVLVQLKRKSDNETSEPKPFTYHPQIIDKEEVQRKRQKTLPNFYDFSGHGSGGGGGLYRGGGGGGGGGGPAAGGGGPGGGAAYYQGFTSFNYGGVGGGGGGGGGFSTGYSGGVSASRGKDSDGEPNAQHNLSREELVLRANESLPEEEEKEKGGKEGSDGGGANRESQTDLEDALQQLLQYQVEALFHYSVTGDSSFLLAPQRPLLAAQDEDGDTGLHLAVLHSQRGALKSLTQVAAALPGEEVLNMRNHLYQTPLHLAVITQQCEAVEALLLAGADPTLTDRHGNTVLHLASQLEGGRGMLECLLRHQELRALLERCNTAGLCAIHLAVLANQLWSLRELLGGGANVEAQERSSGRTALHLATEGDNVSLAGCLLLEGNAQVDCCTFNGSTPLHLAAGRGSVRLTALLMAAGADPHKENCEPLFYKEDVDEEDEEEDEEDEGYIPGSTPLSMTSRPKVLELLYGQGLQPKSPPKTFSPPQGDLGSLALQVKQQVCAALDSEGLWETVSHSLGLGILNMAFRLSPSPATTVLDSYEVSGGTVAGLLVALRAAGGCSALTVLEAALHHLDQQQEDTAANETRGQSQDLKTGAPLDSAVCDSGVELSTA